MTYAGSHRTKILLVDDRRENLLALENLINTPQVEILKALTGDEALSLLLSHDVALAMVDVQMPGMSGLDLARFMRGVERTRRIPIIFVTASQRAPTHVFEGYEQGAVDYLFKPLDPHIVRSKVKVFVELDRKSVALAAQLRETEALRRQAEGANEAKSRFLANMSHEIRTPLGAVLGYADLLRDANSSESERLASLDAIQRNGRHLLQLIDDVLDLSKIEADRMQISRATVALPELLRDLEATHEHKAQLKGLTFSVDVEGLVPESFQTDLLRLRQILHNLIGNAIKFTDKGAVQLTVALRRAEPLQLVFTVRDSGPGISVESAAHLFQPFAQADASISRRHGGTGLGLVIARRLAKLLGGDVRLTDTVMDKGSTFEASIDPGPIELTALASKVHILRTHYDASAANTKATQNHSNAWPRLDGLNVLVVDDSKDNRALFHRLLTHAGATVVSADSGFEAQERVATQTFHVILMDLQMPELDGFEASRRLREQGCCAPILALTAHATPEDKEHTRAAGFADHLTKPVDRRELLTTLQAYLTPLEVDLNQSP